MNFSVNKIGLKIIFFSILPLLLLALLPNQSLAQSQVIVRYFHSDVRCTTCLAFEDWSKTAVEGFPEELANGTLKWEVINFDQAENHHYIKDYGLAEKSLVLVKQEDGKTVRWKNVEEFWDFDENQKDEFVKLAHNLIKEYLTP